MRPSTFPVPATISQNFSASLFCCVDEANDKYRSCNASHVDGFFRCLFGGAQYKVGTDLWATEDKGMIRSPDFGRVLTKDRFERVGRYLSRGPLGCEEDLGNDPWIEVRWILTKFNDKRRKQFRPGWALVPDETMIPWKGNAGPGGIPHISFIKRKPEPLGCELKTVCDASTGLMLQVELQEGKERMARKRYVDEYQATTATTLRLLGGLGVGENSLPVERKPKRVVFADSW